VIVNVRRRRYADPYRDGGPDSSLIGTGDRIEVESSARCHANEEQRCAHLSSVTAALGPTAPPAPLSDANGRFSVEAPVGHVRVTCDPSDNSLSESASDVEVSADGTTHAELIAVREIKPGSNPGIGLETTCCRRPSLRSRSGFPLTSPSGTRSWRSLTVAAPPGSV
jgi:hypothetical protein